MPQSPKLSPRRKAAIERAKRLEGALRTAEGVIKGYADDARWVRELLEGKDPEIEAEGTTKEKA